MAVRLSLKLGVVSDQDRVAGSSDSAIVVEPTIGSVARTKGNLYLLVTSQHSGRRAQEATQLVQGIYEEPIKEKLISRRIEEIKAAKVPKFRPGKGLKDAIN